MKADKIILPALAAFFLSNPSSGQPWYLTRGLPTDEVSWAVDVDSSGNIYWAVEEKDQWPYWYYNIILFKIAPDAQQIWQSNSWGSAYNDIAFKATVNGSNVYLSGRTDSTGNPVSGDALVLCYNINNGGLNWQYTYNPTPDNGYEEIDGLIAQPDGIYLSGWTKGQTTDEDFLIQKINPAGQLEWTNSWDYNGLGKFDGANGHMAMDNNYIYAAGHVNLLDGSLVCFDRSDGSYQWDVTWNGSGNDEVLGLTMSSDSMLYTVGYFGSSQNNSQTCIKKFSRTGQLLWTRIWGGTGTEDSRALVTDGDSMVYIVGTTSSYGYGAKDIFILKYDTAGTLLDSLFWGGAFDETVEDVVMSGEYLYLAGVTKSFGNGQISGDHTADGLLLKINGRTMQAPDTATANVLNEENPPGELNIFPNPSNDYFIVPLANTTNYEVKLFDFTGREVKPDIRPDSNYYEIGIENLPGGIYFLKITAGNFSVTKKIEIIK